VEALQGEGLSVTEMQTFLHTVHASAAERLASKFVTLKTKHKCWKVAMKKSTKNFISMWKDFTFHA
jgi:hypothetical protein